MEKTEKHEPLNFAKRCDEYARRELNMGKFEYKIVELNGPSVNYLNELGEDGWEVCGSWHANYVILKREKR